MCIGLMGFTPIRSFCSANIESWPLTFHQRQESDGGAASVLSGIRSSTNAVRGPIGEWLWWWFLVIWSLGLNDFCWDVNIFFLASQLFIVFCSCLFSSVSSHRFCIVNWVFSSWFDTHGVWKIVLFGWKQVLFLQLVFVPKWQKANKQSIIRLFCHCSICFHIISDRIHDFVRNGLFFNWLCPPYHCISLNLMIVVGTSVFFNVLFSRSYHLISYRTMSVVLIVTSLFDVSFK